MRVFIPLASLVIVGLTGCNRTPIDLSAEPVPGNNTYAREALIRQQAEERQKLDNWRLDESTQEDLLVDTSAYEYADYDRQVHESVDDWLIRLDNQIAMNRDIILRGEQNLDGLETQHNKLVAEIRELLESNAELKEAALSSKPTSFVSQDLNEVVQVEAPFTVHLVRKGETLYSIAQTYYQDPRMVRRIMLWNQGWIERPEELRAGLGVVLFFDSKEQQGLAKVQRFLDFVAPSDSQTPSSG